MPRKKRRHRLSDEATLKHFREARLSLLEQLLAKGANVREFDNWAIRFAAQTGDVDVMRLLLAKGADMNASGGTPLFASVAAGHLEAFKLLLGRGVDIQTGHGEGQL